MRGKSRTDFRRLTTRVGGALAVAVCAAISQAPAATAEPNSDIVVKTDHATLLALAGEPATVVIGNSLFAELTLKKGMIVIHGRHYGSTNVIVLDKDNAELANFELHVIRGGTENLTVRKGTSAFSYVCAPACEGTLHVGDNADHFGSISSAMSAKQALSTGAVQQ